MAPSHWWKKSCQQYSAEAAAALLQNCAICGTHALHRCKNCSQVGYCGRACQIKHWPEHKKECAALKERKLSSSVSPTSSLSSPASPASAATAAPPSNAVLPVAATELYPYEAFLHHWKFISLSGRVPAGIYNLGNTCYINAILQVLFATKPFTAYLLSQEHTCPSPPVNLFSSSKKQWCPLCCLVSLAQEFFGKSSPLKQTNGGGGLRNSDPVTIRNFTHFVQQLNSSFTFGDQHDAQELYVALLDALECVFLREYEAKTKDGAAALKKFDQFSKQTTLMNHVFTCYTRTQVECTECGKVSKSYATDTGIMLSVPNEGKFKTFSFLSSTTASYTLENLLENFTAVEVLEGNDAYRCDACCARVKAHKSNVIEIAPNILAIQLNRVGMNFFSTGEMPQKNSAAIEFPLELDLTPFMAIDAVDAAAPAVYELYAMVTHEGSTTEDGHYISVVRYGGGSTENSTCGGDGNTQEGQWYVCDDDVVSPLPVDIVLKQNEEAYLLFYERKQPRVQQLLGSGGGKSASSIPIGGSSPSESVDNAVIVAPVATEQVKPLENGAEEEDKAEHGAAVSYVFEMVGNGESRALQLQVNLPSVDEEPQIELQPGKPVFAEILCCGRVVRKMPLPVSVTLPAKEIKWNRDAKVLGVLFDAI